MLGKTCQNNLLNKFALVYYFKQNMISLIIMSKKGNKVSYLQGDPKFTLQPWICILQLK